MSDTRSISFDHPFYLSQETQKKTSPWERSFIDPQELDQDPWLDSFQPQKKDSKQLFPTVDPKAALPMETDSIDFDRPFYTAPQEKLASPVSTDKPMLPAPELEPPQAEHASTVQAHADQDTLTQTDADLTKMFQGTVNMLGAVWAQVVDDIYRTRQSGHEHTADTLQTYVKKREKINKDFFDNVEQVHDNAKKQETWSSLYKVVEFLAISTGLVGGIALIAAQQYWAGGQMLAGSALSLGSFALKQMEYDQTYIAALGLSGMLLTGLGMREGWHIFKGDLKENLHTISEKACYFSQMFIHYIEQSFQKHQYKLQGDNNTLNTERIKNRDDLQKTVGGLKMEDLIELSKAASEQIRMKGEIVTRILLGSRM